MPSSTCWYLYIIRCRDGTWYSGITNNLDQRIRDHNRGRGCRYTKYRWPVRLVYSESFPDRSSALRREARIQRWSRRRKEEMMGIRTPARR
ncbi:MAG: GIY-YIG nuclease family protein [bacterium]|nr:GIY-YIG nuclease family protein [bacterium]